MKIKVWSGILRKDAEIFWGLATVSLVAGLALNQARDIPLPLVYISKQARMEQMISRLVTGQSIASSDRPQPIALEELADLVKEGKGIVLDARPEIFYRQGHVPGALSLSREEFERDYRRQRSVLEKDWGQLLAVYCADSICDDGQLVADALSKLGFRRVLLFKGGWNEWREQRLPEEKL
ncbi:MAG: rhodanese-like domain-containing protein [Verrucomicrobiae bacterium]|nr:rhodanese-like domain-containing protein [Verrucomicrobiae bacterium]